MNEINDRSNENIKKGINDLKDEIAYLNTQILDKLFQISTDNYNPNYKLIINKFKEIVTAQREEITKKNENIRKTEDKLIELTEEIIELKKENETSSQPKEALTKLIEELKIENQKVEEKNRMLKAALLMTVDQETKDVSESPDVLTNDQVIKVESKDKTVSLTLGPSKAQAPVSSSEQSERKRQCPKCGATSAFILEIDDKEHVIYIDMGKKYYGKKYKCGDCRHEWK